MILPPSVLIYAVHFSKKSNKKVMSSYNQSALLHHEVKMYYIYSLRNDSIRCYVRNTCEVCHKRLISNYKLYDCSPSMRARWSTSSSPKRSCSVPSWASHSSWQRRTLPNESNLPTRLICLCVIFFPPTFFQDQGSHELPSFQDVGDIKMAGGIFSKGTTCRLQFGFEIYIFCE